MKKINKILIFLFLFLLMFFITSCSKKIKTYESDNGIAFLEKIKEYSLKNEHDYVLIDVRDLDEEYAKGHFFGFTNYDLSKGNLDEFGNFVESMYNKEKTMFIIDRDGTFVESVSQKLKKIGYKKIYVYLGGYEKLNEYNVDETYIRVVTGKEGCNC